jgi:hypothetical protein
VLQWRRRCDLAEGGELLRLRALDGGGKVGLLETILEIPPNLLYAKVRSQDPSPSRLQIDGR